ncbi:methyltransferase, TIGR04325 family [Leptospira broomii serovar Hurstbridge str. 5399]|uniref:Methyltransferase, TIGR04325 family n=1 Tax=Leptospira broomii serovar Hurstbridge str. 5399 TaxID=1049789 RepID=T0GN10_9LEPT|nr:methyltransferase, TIGR04325 family [Leptospira broomii]EQA46728.1 methyltransferase, TIGR04325 family [Leptospira broomii serovar Hurstbridge str. 5399]
MKRFFGKVLRRLSRYFLEETNEHEWFYGNFQSWKDALNECEGYDSPNILNQVKKSLLKVKSGEAIYERDSVLFDRIEYSFPLLTGLLYAAASSSGRLSVLDFGGSLGSSYFQNRTFMDKLSFFRWSIVEQTHFVEEGIKNFQDENLKFYHTASECVSTEKPNVLILSSSLPYLCNPYEILESLLSHGIPYIIIDRTPFFLDENPDRILIERVPPEIYDARYPIWFFNEKKFLEFMDSKYSLKEEFLAIDPLGIKGENTKYKAFIFVKR